MLPKTSFALYGTIAGGSERGVEVGLLLMDTVQCSMVLIYLGLGQN